MRGLIARTILGGILGLILAGCAGWEPPSVDLPSIPWLSRDRSPTPQVTPLSLWVWDEGPERRASLERALAQFQKAHPDVTVELTVLDDYAAQLQAALERGQPPDALLVDGFRFPQLASAGHLAPGQGRLDGPEDFYPQLVPAFTLEGAAYCRPREVRTLALISNQEALAEAGLQPPTTWEELRQAAELLSDPNGNAFGLIIAPDLSRWLPFLFQAGGQLFDSEGRLALDSPQALQALNFYLQLFRDNVAGQPAESLSSWAGEAFGKGKGAMTLEGNWIVPYLAAEFPDVAYQVTPLPQGPGGRGTVAFTSCYAVAAASPHPALAFQLVNFLTGAQVMADWPPDGGAMPSRLSLASSWRQAFPALAPFLDGVGEARVWQLPPGQENVLPVFNRRMLQLFAAEIEPEDLLFAVMQAASREGP